MSSSTPMSTDKVLLVKVRSVVQVNSVPFKKTYFTHIGFCLIFYLSVHEMTTGYTAKNNAEWGERNSLF